MRLSDPGSTKCRFQSTLSLRRATSAHTPDLPGKAISIHALLAESDPAKSSPKPPQEKFQSTLSLRRATTSEYRRIMASLISIHALLAESDVLAFLHFGILEDFNPRSPCGERPVSSAAGSETGDFNPRSPCGERPFLLPLHVLKISFQSTLSLRRATTAPATTLAASSRFQSTLSLRRATPAYKTWSTKP